MSKTKTKTRPTVTDTDTPPGTDPKRWEELAAAEEKQNKKSSISKSDEKKFASIYADTIAKFDRLTSNYNEAGVIFNKKKAELVRDLANTMKKLGYRVDEIANEIVHQLKGRAGRSWILEVLDDQYKNKTRQEAAKKRTTKDVPTQPADAHGIGILSRV